MNNTARKMTQHSKTSVISFRPTDEVNNLINAWLKQNSFIDRTALINMAIFSFISKPQTLEGVEVIDASEKETMDALDTVMVEHSGTMKKLKDN